jgi:hypothetical protein
VELNGKDVRELLDTERASGYGEAPEETPGIFSFLVIDVQ